MDPNAQRAKEKIGEDRWNLIMASVDAGTLKPQKMRDLAFGLGLTVGGNHERRIEAERKLPDRSEMSRILADWWELDEDFGRMTVEEVIQKLVALFRHDDIRLNPLARALEETLNTSSEVAAVPGSEGTTSAQPGSAQSEPGLATPGRVSFSSPLASGSEAGNPSTPGRVTLYNLLKPEVRKPVRGHDFLANLAYECNFGEDFETYLEQLKPGTNPDMKVNRPDQKM